MEMNIEQIMEVLPHRYPFLLVDRITELEPGKGAKGIKCVTVNEPFFQGHFPQQKVMPGVLILEALAQTGAAALLSEPEFAGGIVLFGGVKECRFKRPVVPGDVLELSCEIKNRRGPAGFGTAIACVDGKVACKAEISFVIQKS